EVGFQEEVSAVDELDARARNIAPERFSTGRAEDFVVRPPDGENRHLRPTEPLMKPRIQHAVGGVVAEQVELGAITARAGEKHKVVLPRVGIDGRWVGNSVRVLPLDGLTLKSRAERRYGFA